MADSHYDKYCMQKVNSIPKFMTIRQTAATGILSEHHLRLMQKRGELPGIYTGNRFMVNYNLLVEYLNVESGKRRHSTYENN